MEYIDRYIGEIVFISTNLNKNEIQKVIDILFKAWKNNKQVFLMGNGGSASNATHFAADLAKTVKSEGKQGLKAFSLTDCIPLCSAYTNDEGWENVYKGQLETVLNEDDVVIGLSVHGGSGKGNAGNWSENLTKALQYAKDKGAVTVGFAGFDGGAMKRMCDACVVVPSESTPQVESFHSVLQHLIVFRLKEMIENG